MTNLASALAVFAVVGGLALMLGLLIGAISIHIHIDIRQGDEKDVNGD